MSPSSSQPPRTWSERSPKACSEACGAANSALAACSTPPQYGHRGDRALEELARRRSDEIGERLADLGLDLAALAAQPPSGGALAELGALLQDANAGLGNAIPGEAEDPDADARADLAAALRGRVASELDLLRTRLLGNEPDLFSAIDRMRSEAELRFAVAAPLIGLILVFAVRDSFGWLVAVAGVAVLWRQARSRLQESGDMLVDSLLVGRVSAPTLERTEQDIERLSALEGLEARRRALAGPARAATQSNDHATAAQARGV